MLGNPSPRRAPLGVAALLALALGFVVLQPAWAQTKARTHTVYAGQRLASIAKRYNVTVEELCQANGIRETTPIRPGQKLVIPDKGGDKPSDKGTDKGGDKPSDKGGAKAAPTSATPTAATRPAKPQRPGEPEVHLVAKGHTLSAIASRYRVTVIALCNASGLNEKTPLRVGQSVIVPAPSDPGGEYARKLRLSGAFDQVPKVGSSVTYRKYEKKPWRRGYVTLNAHGKTWKGYVVGSNGEVLPQASAKINWAMSSRSDGPQIDPRLIRLIAQVSDQFGGRPLRIVSGFRTKSFVAASKHKEGRALDFSIPGVPNEALRDYLRSLRNVGVGYYPNSSFVHLDVRGYNAFWIDYAGPGEAPRKHPKRPGDPVKPRPRVPDDAGHDHDEPGDEDEPPDDTAVDPMGGEEPGNEPLATPEPPAALTE
ncbi:MAG TPA: LysM peptidoglycan-binding domain-containing protein [Polyangiaceae bacterium]|nr:LysM peptidoglycan-binding domain-containing protein [Polyangiaceae bacterium]